MADTIKFTEVTTICEGKSYTFKMQEGISIRDKKGKEFLFKDGKWKVWTEDISSGRRYGSFKDYEEYDGGFLGFFQKKKERPDIELHKAHKQCLDAIMDNDGNKNDLTIQDIDIARGQYEAGNLKKDFVKHGIRLDRRQGEYSGYKDFKLQVDIEPWPGTFRIDYYPNNRSNKGYY